MGWEGGRRRRGRFERFAERYCAELEDPEHRAAVTRLLELASTAAVTPVTPVTSVREVERSHVPVLLRHLERPGGD